MRNESWSIPVLLVVSLIVFLTRFGLLGAVVVNTPNYSYPLLQEARDKGWPRAIAKKVQEREISLVLSYWSHWHYDYFSLDVTVFKLDPWSRRPWLSCLNAFGSDRFSIIHLNYTAVVLPPPLRVLLLAVWYKLALNLWRRWQRERWSDEVDLLDFAARLPQEPTP